MFNISIYGGTDRGMVRANNQDSICCNQFDRSSQALAIVADGVGGHAGGEVASKITVDCIEDYFKKALLLAHSGAGYPENWLLHNLEKAVLKANQQIKQKQDEDIALSSMATTVVMMLVVDDMSGFAYLGDSRLYAWRNNKLDQLSKDHTVAQQMVDEGTITDIQASVSPYNHVLTNGLGIKADINIILSSLDIRHGDTFLLCSDGLTGCLTDKEISAILKAEGDLEHKVDELIAAANDNGGRDNISVILLHCEEQAS